MFERPKRVVVMGRFLMTGKMQVSHVQEGQCRGSRDLQASQLNSSLWEGYGTNPSSGFGSCFPAHRVWGKQQELSKSNSLIKVSAYCGEKAFDMVSQCSFIAI